MTDHPEHEQAHYPTCTVIAEKIEALVRLDEQNPRMKDFFDLDFLLAGGANDRYSLDAAIRATFKRRGSVLPTEVPTGHTPAFAGEKLAFLRKNEFHSDALSEVVGRIQSAMECIWKDRIRSGFQSLWKPGKTARS